MSQERVSGFQEKGLTSGEVPELPGKFGKLPGNLRIAVKFHSERTSGEVAENFRGSSGNFRGSPGTSQKLGGACLPTSDSPNSSPKNPWRKGKKSTGGNSKNIEWRHSAPKLQIFLSLVVAERVLKRAPSEKAPLHESYFQKTPCPSFPCFYFFEFLVFWPCKEFLVCFFGRFPLLFQGF